MIRLAAQVRRGATIVVGVAGAFDNGGTAAGFIAYPRHGLALYVRGRTGDDFGGAVAGEGAAMEVTLAGYGFHRLVAISAICHWPSRVL